MPVMRPVAGRDQLVVRIEQIGRRVDLDRGLVAAARARVAAHAHDGRVRQQQRHRVVEPRVRGGAAGAEGVGDRVVEVACLPGGSGVSLFTEPPSASTLPLGRMTAFIWMRPVDMFGPGVQLGEGAERSMISVVAVAGCRRRSS